MSKISEISLDELKVMVAESSSFKELQIKIGYSPNSGKIRPIIEAYCNEHNISLDHITSVSTNKTVRTPENTFVEDSTASQATVRRLYKKGAYTPYECAICGQQPFWNGKELTLTLDHINGINTDDRLENLRWVCPNCDRQLDTFSGKNVAKGQYEPRINAAQKYYCESCGKEISRGSTLCMDCYAVHQRKVKERPDAISLKEILISNNGNFTAVGKLFNVTDNTIRKWCKKYNMPTHSVDYKQGI